MRLNEPKMAVQLPNPSLLLGVAENPAALGSPEAFQNRSNSDSVLALRN